MNVVVRGVMAAGLGIYSAFHFFQAGASPTGTPGWLTIAFVLTAIAGLGFAALLIAAPERVQAMVEGGAALLAGLSLIALAMSYTTGFFGVSQTEVVVETALVAVAEVMVLLAFGIAQRFRSVDSVQEVGAGRREPVPG